MKTIRIIAGRELRAMFDHPTGYILLIVYLAVTDVLYFGQVFLMGAASLRPMLDLLPWILLFFVPAVTMRALAEDARSGTLEVVLAQPVTEVELLFGKYLGHLAFVLIGLGLTLPIPMGLALGADLHVGVLVSQYVGSALLAAALVSVGVWASSLTPNQITAFILAIAVMFVLILIGVNPMVTGLPPSLGTVAANVSVLPHFENINRGVIDLRDAVYFVTLAGVFVSLAYFSLRGRRLSRRGAARRRLQTGTLLLVVALVVVNLLGRHIGGRLDLTPGKAYTLSAATKELLVELEDIVTITLYASDEVPHGLEFLKRDIQDLIRDFRAAGDGQVRIVIVDPKKDEAAEQDARTAGVRPIQFNVVGEREFKVSEGYLGIAVQYADGSESIPFVQRSDDLEYRVASIIRSLTRSEQPALGFVEASVPGGSPGPSFSRLRQLLSQQYDVRTILLDDSLPIDSEIRALVLAGSPPFLTDSQAQRFTAYLEGGGGALIMASGMMRRQQGFMAGPMPVGWNRILAPYGVWVRPDMVYDLASNEWIGFGVAMGQLNVKYPFWVRALSTRLVVVNRDVESIVLPWTSSVAVADSVADLVTPLFTTSQVAGRETGTALIHPQRDYPQDDLGVHVLAVLVNPLTADSAVVVGRVVVVGNSGFVSDRHVESAPGGAVFVLNAVDWLAEDDALIAIRSKNRQPPPLRFESEWIRDMVKWGNIAGVPLALVVFGAVRLWRRRLRTRRVYRVAASEAA